jgi:hypothetical protein
MSEVIEQESREAPAATDLWVGIQRVMGSSDEPLTVSKIRAALPGGNRRMDLDELSGLLRRHVEAGVLHQYPKYRSAQDRFWDRPMPVHVANLLREALTEGPLAWPQLRRKLPEYAVTQAETALQEQIAQGRLFRHPPAGSRGGERYGVTPPDAREYLRRDLPALFSKLQELGFSEPQLREAAMAVLQEEEWGRPEAETAAQQASQPNASEGAPAPAESTSAAGGVP